MTALMPILDAPATHAVTPVHVRVAAALDLIPHIDPDGTWTEQERGDWAELRATAVPHVAVCDAVWTARQSEVDALRAELAATREQLRHIQWCNASMLGLVDIADPDRLRRPGRLEVHLAAMKLLGEPVSPQWTAAELRR